MSTAARYVETDALAGLRDELMRAAARRRPSRRRGRRAATVVAIAVGLLAGTAGAAELTGFSTGVEEIDELIGVERGLLQPPGSPFPDRTLGAGGATEPLLVPMGDGTYKMVAYLSRRGDVCVVYADRHRGGVRGGGGGCPPLEDLNRTVERRGAAWQGSSHGLDSRTNQFIVDGRVEAIRPLGEGDWEVLMTPPWTPEAPNARPLRLVVVIDDRDLGNLEDGMQMDELPREAYNQPTLELTYSDGEKRVWEGPQAK
jgi:hypothetical protein